MKSRLLHPETACTMLLLAMLAAPATMAAGFSVLVSPPRFELSGNPGEVLRDHVEINNPDSRPVSLELRTADWDMDENGATTFHPPELQPGSCRPWTRIERRTISLPAQTSKRFRFQIEIPEDAPPGECRLALLIQAPEDDAVIARANSLSFPVQGRIAVIMYIAIGDARPEVVLEDVALEEHHGRLTPVAVLHNRGIAHARTTGYVDASDSNGKRLEFAVASVPILPGQTRRVLLQQAVAEGSRPAELAAPLEMSGAIEWGSGEVKFSRQVDRRPATD